MKLSRMCSRLMVAVAALGVGFGATSASAAEVTLRFAHFFPAAAPFHKELYVPWAESIEKASNGRIKVEIYPSQTLAKVQASYEAVRNQVADVTGTIQAYSPNRFPLTQIVELPGVTNTAVNAACTVQKMYDQGLIANEYEDTHVLFMFAHGSGEIHTKGKVIKTPQDLAGMRVRRPSTLIGEMLERIGAQPVGMPATETYQALQRDVVDANMSPYEALVSFRLNELVKTHTETQGLYTIAFVVTMNKDVYNGLPADLKKIVDDHSGMDWALKAGKLFDDRDQTGRKQAEDMGHTFYSIEGGVAHNAAWKPVIDEMVEGYLTDLEGKGLKARDVYAKTLEISSTCPSL